MSTSIVLQDDDDYGYIVRYRRNDDKNAASGGSGRMGDGAVGDEHRNLRSDQRKFVLRGKTKGRWGCFEFHPEAHKSAAVVWISILVMVVF